MISPVKWELVLGPTVHVNWQCRRFVAIYIDVTSSIPSTESKAITLNPKLFLFSDEIQKQH